MSDALGDRFLRDVNVIERYFLYSTVDNKGWKEISLDEFNNYYENIFRRENKKSCTVSWVEE